ncbi:MAG: acetyl-CoA hydrolase/transferase C-terminal domain-containing protein [Microscillaceae bacterium]|nr:acetyl-CoA hydrolase/transferase C-terminal domain-containing protein [Microscillaceae bacterium]
MNKQDFIISTPEDALSLVQSNQQVFIHGTSATPHALIAALVNRADELENVTLHHLHVEGEAPYADPKYKGIFRVNSLFTGGNLRQAVNEGRADYVPVFLSEVPLLFRRRIIPLDVSLIQVSPPDKNGYCTLGTSVDVALAAVQSSRYVIAEINRKMPRTHGDSAIHISKIDKAIEVDRPLFSHPVLEPEPLELKIGQFIAELVEDGATLQMGIGAIPNAALASLSHHKALGIHTEMFSDGVIPLIEKGIITNEHKVKHRNHIVSGFLVGSQKLYDFVDDNPLVRMLDITYVNDTSVIRQNPKVTAINSAIEVDLTGQVCSDSIGNYIFSGVGGQMDFMRGASLSEGGKPIIALPSVTSKGLSRITAFLKQGAGVVTTRAHVHYIVTEYGVAHLYGKNIRQRAKALIEIAHPDHRERLEKECYECLK